MNEIVKNREGLKSCKRIVVKVGSKVLVDKDGTPDIKNMLNLAEEMSFFQNKGSEMALVSSGAIGSGLEALGIKERPEDITKLQMAAAVGQLRLISIYDDLFQKKKCAIGQILLTHDVLNNKEQYINAQNTLLSLINHKIIPIINENDTVSTEEIKFGDNDVLAALVANLINADALILLSTIDGLGKSFSNNETERISLVEKIDDSIFSHVNDIKNNLSSGGMTSKLQSARLATLKGIPVIIADGRKKNILKNILNGDDEGTLFLPFK